MNIKRKYSKINCCIFFCLKFAFSDLYLYLFIERYKIMIEFKLGKESYKGDGDKFYYLYKIVNNVNGKYYYGVHSTNNLNDGYSGSGKIIKRAINCYGVENFTKYILNFFRNEKDMYQAEKEILTEKEINNNNCYNVSSGGLGGRQGMVVVKDENGETIVVSREVAKEKKYISVNVGSGNPSYGKTRSEESRLKMSQKMTKYYMTHKYRNRTESEKEHQRNIMTGRFAIKKDDIIKYISKENLETYISNGWQVMCSKKYYINNGITSILVNRYEHETQYHGWNKGKLKEKIENSRKTKKSKVDKLSKKYIQKWKIGRYKGKLYEYNGGKYTVKELSEKTGLCCDTVRSWLKKYGTVDREIVNKIKESDDSKYTGKKYEYNGERLTIVQISKKYNINISLLKGRIRLGWDIAECIENRNIKNRKKKTYIYQYNGEFYTIPELSGKFGISQTMLRQRLMKGMNINDAMTLPNASDIVKKFLYQGKEYTIREISETFNIKLSTVKSRFKKGWTPEQVIETPMLK